MNTITACYDLVVSPPTYDFITFLAQAEEHRIKMRADRIDLVVQPGMRDGFRNDDLPPDLAERRSMLQRVVLAGARLLPSVSDVVCFGQRTNIKADFPVGWDVLRPLNHYGPEYFVGAKPVLQATEAARRIAKRITGSTPYIVIPVRQAAYWPHRNTNVKAWQEAVEFVKEYGWNVFWIPDTNGDDVPGEKNVRAASLDIDLRLALYEGAKLVTGLIGGAACLSIFGNVAYAFLHPLTDDKPTTDRAYLRRLGVEMVKPWTPRGTVVFGMDTPAAAKKLLWEHFYGAANETEALEMARAG